MVQAAKGKWDYWYAPKTREIIGYVGKFDDWGVARDVATYLTNSHTTANPCVPTKEGAHSFAIWLKHKQDRLPKFEEWADKHNLLWHLDHRSRFTHPPSAGESEALIHAAPCLSSGPGNITVTAADSKTAFHIALYLLDHRYIDDSIFAAVKAQLAAQKHVKGKNIRIPISPGKTTDFIAAFPQPEMLLSSPGSDWAIKTANRLYATKQPSLFDGMD